MNIWLDFLEAITELKTVQGNIPPVRVGHFMSSDLKVRGIVPINIVFTKDYLSLLIFGIICRQNPKNRIVNLFGLIKMINEQRRARLINGRESKHSIHIKLVLGPSVIFLFYLQQEIHVGFLVSRTDVISADLTSDFGSIAI